MNILALDTSTPQASIAIATESTVLAELSFTCQRSLSGRLSREIEQLLSLSGLNFNDIDLFASSIGPGSFTGVRCGVATIQGLALAVGKPCVGFSSLAQRALNFPCSATPVCTLLDARKSEVYAALYDCRTPLPTALIDDCVMPLDQFMELVEQQVPGNIVLAGDGAIRYHDQLAARLGERALFAPPSHNLGRAATGVMLALHQFRHDSLHQPQTLLPRYIRPSDAEINRLTTVST